MRTILTAAAIAIAIAIAEHGGPKGFTSGNQLYNDCSAEAGSFEKGFCVGYVIDASDAHGSRCAYQIQCPAGLHRPEGAGRAAA
jgi:hypothetical protein